MEKKLNMPLTEFNQRSNSVVREPELLKLWKDLDVLNKRNLKNTNEFVLHDGPAYSNGGFHAGHLLNKVLKDMSNKYHLMNGKKVDFKVGHDCHGLPTELAVQKKFGLLNATELRQRCKEWASTYSNLQDEECKSFGVFANWSNGYYTMTKEYEVKQLEVLYQFLNKKLLYPEKRPVYYSPSTRTVLAESELEYKDRVDNSAYFTLDLDDGRKLLVWTTQPWTVLGNVAVCVNSNLTYVDVEYNSNVYVLLKNKASLLSDKVLKEYSGKELVNLSYTNRLTNTKGLVVEDSFVKDESGTGLVHLCPAHGDEDFEVCQRYNLNLNDDLTDNKGNLLFNNLFCLDKGSEDVLNKMESLGMLFKVEKYNHSYPHDWRTGGPVYYKLMEQYFLDLKELKNDCLSALKEVEFSDNKYRNRLVNMLEKRDKWCLSRQRKWGFPLAVFLKDNKPFFNDELYSHLRELFMNEGSDCWFSKNVNELLPEKYKSLGLSKCEHTLDVWFDSGVSWMSVVSGQSDVYLEGADQCRGWFQSSLLTSVALTGKAPYKKLVTHGFVLDQNGNKMSKSLGNVVNPKELQTKFNTDVVRLYVATVDYNNDVNLSERSLKTCADYYFKFRNTLKYLLGNMYGFNNDVELREKDKLALSKNELMYNNCLEYYNNFNFRKAFEEMMSWLNDFSGKYLDLETKSFLYEYDLNSKERQTCQYVMKDALEKFMKVLAPMCSFLAEDAYQHYEFKKFETVFFEKL